MKIVYDTKTGHSKSIALKIDSNAVSVSDIKKLEKDEKVILITHTEGKGLVPKNTETFMKKHHGNVIGYVITGNYIKHPFEFGFAGLKLFKEYGKPVIRLIQQEGDDADIRFVLDYIKNLENFK